MMRALILGFIQIAMRSLVLMAVMLTICLSLITREFPPDFGRILRTYEQLQNYNVAASSVPNLHNSEEVTASTIKVTEESEIEKLSDLYEKRAQIGRSLLDPKSSQSLKSPFSNEVMSSSVSGDVEILRARLLTCEDRLRLYENLDTESKSSEE